QPLNIAKSINEATLTVTFNDTVSDGTINVYSNNKPIATYAIDDNTNSVDVTINNINLPLGENELTIEYTGSQLYDDASTTTTLTIFKANTTVSIDPVVLSANKTVTITARVDAVDTDAVVDGGKVVFKLNGKTLKDETGKVIYVKVVNGIASLEYSLEDRTDFTDLELTATYSGSNSFESSKSDAVTIEKPDEITTAVITVDDMTAKVGDTVTINATIKDLQGNNVQSGKVIIKINGKTLKDSNGKVVYAYINDGKISVDYDTTGLKARDYTVSVIMVANSFYDKTQTDATLTLEK
ncbi:MAG: Ig-like domain repeat protein, partial [Methanosphaera sp.]|nr:Ig-like domain repeat protein [Methanosphaera sp.]